MERHHRRDDRFSLVPVLQPSSRLLITSRKSDRPVRSVTPLPCTDRVSTVEPSTIRLVRALINRTCSHSAAWDAIYTAFQAFLYLRPRSTRAEYAAHEAQLNEHRVVFLLFGSHRVSRTRSKRRQEEPRERRVTDEREKKRFVQVVFNERTRSSGQIGSLHSSCLGTIDRGISISV